MKIQKGIYAKIQKLEQLDHKYGFGVFRDTHGKELLGIERHDHNGLEGRSNIDFLRHSAKDLQGVSKFIWNY